MTRASKRRPFRASLKFYVTPSLVLFLERFPVRQKFAHRQSVPSGNDDRAARSRFCFAHVDRLDLRSRQHALSASLEPVFADRREDDGLCVGAADAAARRGAQAAEGTLSRIRHDAARPDGAPRDRSGRLPREGPRHRLFVAGARSGARRGHPAAAGPQVHLHQRRPQACRAHGAPARHPRPFRRHFRHRRRPA